MGEKFPAVDFGVGHGLAWEHRGSFCTPSLQEGLLQALDTHQRSCTDARGQSRRALRPPGPLSAGSCHFCQVGDLGPQWGPKVLGRLCLLLGALPQSRCRSASFFFHVNRCRPLSEQGRRGCMDSPPLPALTLISGRVLWPPKAGRTMRSQATVYDTDTQLLVPDLSTGLRTPGLNAWPPGLGPGWGWG